MDAISKLTDAQIVLKLGGTVGSKLTIAELQTIPKPTLYGLGFGNWDSHLVLLPLWAVGAIADGESLVSIMGERVEVGKDNIDLDTRGGLIAYGFLSTAGDPQ
jgi:hypothetical protein